MRRFQNRYHPLIRYQLGFHAEYTTSEELLTGLAKLAARNRAPVYTHNSETAREVEECPAEHKTTPTVYLDSLGLFEYGGGGYHCVHMTGRTCVFSRKRSFTR